MRTPSRILLSIVGVLLTVPTAFTQPPTPGSAELVEKENKVDAAKGTGKWTVAEVGLALAVADRVRTGELSRAAVRLTDLSMLRLDELTKIEILPPTRESTKPVLDISSGAAYFFSREKPRELEIRTPAATGGLRGTEFHVRVGPGGRTQVTMFDGEVELSNAAGRVLIRSGEQAEVEPGKAPRKTAMLEAVNIIQWCLYYPGVLDVKELGFSAGDERMFGGSLAAYRAGDLLGALEKLPKGGAAGGVGAKLYRAGVLLAVGQVDKARAAMAGVPAQHPGRLAIEQMIAAVKFQEWSREGEASTAGEWMAESYYQQSRADLESALRAAKRAVELSPEFGFAWARMAELEFSFGRTPQAIENVKRALVLAPRNAQAHSLEGFLFTAQNRIAFARRSFEQALALDGALGNAWLGRGLCFIRGGHATEGRLDLQTAAVMEPNRSILRSYLGKAFSQAGNAPKAYSEFQRAKDLDPNDPTPWLYSAIQNKQENRYNQAVDDLEKSIELNDNRRVYRSKFLLDQDLSIRGANLAAIYLNDGMREQSVREAVRAVNHDYSSASAHLFLANSYDALRDPSRILLRYETGWFNELLLSNLLSPVGGGPLSQFVSQQEYSKLFQSDGLGISSVTDYFSSGELRETASQYGTFGNISYALDAEYQFNNGLRPNNEISRLETYATFKFQISPQDTLFLQTKFEDLENGDLFQRYDQGEVGRETSTEVRGADGKLHKVVKKNVAALTTDFRETQDPALILAGWHHEWSPGNHTLLLVGRLANDQVLTADATNQTILTRDVALLAPQGLLGQINDLNPDRPLTNRDAYTALKSLTGRGRIQRLNTFPFDSEYRANFETYTGELSQILTLGPQTFVAGGRYQRGQFETQVLLDSGVINQSDVLKGLFNNPPARQDATVDFERINLYLYDTWRLARWLSVTGGVTYDSLKYPDNFRNPPVNERQASLDKVSPKGGFILQPTRNTVIRGAYSEAISGTSFDESIRLEPTQIAGFTQAYRTLLSESLLGSVAGSEFKFWGISLEQKLPTRTYFGAEFNVLQQDFDRTIGVFDFLDSGGNLPPAVLPSSLAVKDNYREDVLTVSLNQLAGNNWSFGSRYRYTRSHFTEQLAGFRDALLLAAPADLTDLARNAEMRRESGFHEVSLYALYNHPSGFFARGEANWFSQSNDTLTAVGLVTAKDGSVSGENRARAFRSFTNSGPAGDDFWQFNLYAGYRFYRNQCELSCGLLNLTGEDYQLDPLNPYNELPRDRTLLVRVKFSF